MEDFATQTIEAATRAKDQITNDLKNMRDRITEFEARHGDIGSQEETETIEKKFSIGARSSSSKIAKHNKRIDRMATLISNRGDDHDEAMGQLKSTPDYHADLIGQLKSNAKSLAKNHDDHTDELRKQNDILCNMNGIMQATGTLREHQASIAKSIGTLSVQLANLHECRQDNVQKTNSSNSRVHVACTDEREAHEQAPSHGSSSLWGPGSQMPAPHSSAPQASPASTPSSSLTPWAAHGPCEHQNCAAGNCQRAVAAVPPNATASTTTTTTATATLPTAQRRRATNATTTTWDGLRPNDCLYARGRQEMEPQCALRQGHADLEGH